MTVIAFFPLTFFWLCFPFQGDTKVYSMCMQVAWCYPGSFIIALKALTTVECQNYHHLVLSGNTQHFSTFLYLPFFLQVFVYQVLVLSFVSEGITITRGQPVCELIAATTHFVCLLVSPPLSLIVCAPNIRISYHCQHL